MATINNKVYNEFMARLEAMSDGVKKYQANNTRIAANFSEAEIKTLKSELESLRENYIQRETEARKAYDAFAEQLRLSQVMHANNTRIVKGIMGRTAEELKDFGVFPEKATKPKSKAKVKA